IVSASLLGAEKNSAPHDHLGPCPNCGVAGTRQGYGADWPPLTLIGTSAGDLREHITVSCERMLLRASVPMDLPPFLKSCLAPLDDCHRQLMARLRQQGGCVETILVFLQLTDRTRSERSQLTLK